jgi:hypothetical protein
VVGREEACPVALLQVQAPALIRITCSEVKPGSIELKIILTVCIAGTFQFLKDWSRFNT